VLVFPATALAPPLPTDPPTLDDPPVVVVVELSLPLQPTRIAAKSPTLPMDSPEKLQPQSPDFAKVRIVFSQLPR
jgi:hypothetical protein